MSHLNTAEAVPLGYAMVARVAEDAGVRALGIKGPRAAELKLRAPKQSVDVDILVDPASRGPLIAAMGKLGWWCPPDSRGAFIMEEHSIQLKHANWPVEIDLHDRFPGFFAQPHVVFEELWRTREAWSSAGAVCWALNKDSALLVETLHLLRDCQLSAERLSHLAMAAASTKNDVVRLAQCTGALPFLESGIVDKDVIQQIDESIPPIDEEQAVAWQVRTMVGRQVATPAIWSLRRTKGVARIKLLFSLIFLPAQEALLRRPDLWGKRHAGIRAVLARWVRGMRALPAAWTLVRGAERRYLKDSNDC